MDLERIPKRKGQLFDLPKIHHGKTTTMYFLIRVLHTGKIGLDRLLDSRHRYRRLLYIGESARWLASVACRGWQPLAGQLRAVDVEVFQPTSHHQQTFLRIRQRG